MNDSSKDCKIYIIDFFLVSDPLISNFVRTPPIENSKMPDTYMKIIYSQRVRFCPNLIINPC